MNRRKQSVVTLSFDRSGEAGKGIFSRCEPSPAVSVNLPLKKELLELCTEIAGALLRGYTDGKEGRAVRKVIVEGLVQRMKCSPLQACALVDLSLELIHLEAFGRYRRDTLELSLLLARGGGEVADLSLN